MSEQNEPTANDQEQRRPPPRRKASPKRPPPARQPKPVAGGGNGDDPIAMLVKQNQELMARLERVESGRMRTTEPAVEPKPEFVLTDAMSDFTRGLVERTHEVPDVVPRDPLYNIPSRLYLKPPPKNRPDQPPTYVWLQGDASSRAYYSDKGFYLLSPEEARQYVEVEKPKILREQRAKAALINALRKLVEREHALDGYVDDAEWDDSLSGMTIERLEEEWHTLCRQTANPERRLPRAERVREERDADEARLMSGVETVAPRSVVDALEQQAEDARRRRAGRTIEVTPQNFNQFR
jgi:hypothetical protein